MQDRGPVLGVSACRAKSSASAIRGVLLLSLILVNCSVASRFTPSAIVLDWDLLRREPSEAVLCRLEAVAPVILIAPPERQTEFA